MKIIQLSILGTLLFFLSTEKINAQCAPPVYIGFSIHLEDNWTDDTNRASFIDHALRLRNGVKFFKPHGAKYTAESAIPFAKGCYNWGDNVLQALVDSGMGVGSHANASFNFNYTKSIIDGLVGSSNNKTVSGGWGPMDAVIPNNWADSAIAAGFISIGHPVYYAYLSIPQNERPDSVSNQAITGSLYHDATPPEFEKRIHPHRISSAFTFHIDTAGSLIFLTGSLGEMSSIAEGRKNCFPNCVLDSTDIDSIVFYINKAVQIAQQQPSKLTVVYMHCPLHLLIPQNKKFYDYLFTSLASLANQGLIKYATNLEIANAFIQCEQTIGIKVQSNQDHNLNIYPNPSNGKFIVEIEDKISSTENGVIEIYNVFGKKLFQSEISNPKSEINLNFPNGMYFYNVKNNKHFFSSGILIVQ